MSVDVYQGWIDVILPTLTQCWSLRWKNAGTKNILLIIYNAFEIIRFINIGKTISSQRWQNIGKRIINFNFQSNISIDVFGDLCLINQCLPSSATRDFNFLTNPTHSFSYQFAILHWRLMLKCSVWGFRFFSKATSFLFFKTRSVLDLKYPSSIAF